MDVTELTLHDENFWPSWTQTADGKIYLVDGANTAIVRVDGLDTITRLPASSGRSPSTTSPRRGHTWSSRKRRARTRRGGAS